MEISVPVTVIETPAIRVAAIRAYAEDTTGEKAIAEVWAADLDPELKRRIPVPKGENMAETLGNIGKMIEDGKVSDIKAVTYTLPKSLTGVPKKTPDIMESGISARDLNTKFEYAKSILGTLVSITDVFKTGTLVDTAAITIGKGTQGPAKRWGTQLMKGKHSRQGSLRQIGTLGASAFAVYPGESRRWVRQDITRELSSISAFLRLDLMGKKSLQKAASSIMALSVGIMC